MGSTETRGLAESRVSVYRVDLTVPRWMASVVAEAEEQGLNRRVEYLLMGMEL